MTARPKSSQSKFQSKHSKSWIYYNHFDLIRSNTYSHFDILEHHELERLIVSDIFNIDTCKMYTWNIENLNIRQFERDSLNETAWTRHLKHQTTWPTDSSKKPPWTSDNLLLFPAAGFPLYMRGVSAGFDVINQTKSRLNAAKFSNIFLQQFSVIVELIVISTQSCTPVTFSLIKVPNKQARKSSEDAQAAGYAQFEKVWAG